MVTSSIKSFYRLSGDPNSRIILRCLAESYGATMKHDFVHETTIITAPDDRASKEIGRRFHKIQAYAHMHLAVALARHADNAHRTVKANFMRGYADTIVGRLRDGDEFSNDVKYGSRAMNDGAEAACKADIA